MQGLRAINKRTVATGLAVIIAMLVCSFLNNLQAQELPHLEKRVVVVGRSNSTVTRSVVQLGDIADISADDRREDEAVIALSRIVIDQSPPPGQSITLPGNRLLERIRGAGVDMNMVRYTIPQTVSIERAGRVVTKNELEPEVQRLLSQGGREISIRDIIMTSSPQIAPGAVQFQISHYPSSTPGRESFSVRILQVDAPVVEFQIQALIDEWREVAIARRQIPRGAIVNNDDIAMARLKTTMVPHDRAAAPPQIIGLSAAADIAAGEVFRASKLLVPAVVRSGERVTILYRSRLMEATAQGTALENAGMNAAIRVRNDSSRKVIVGRVIEEGLVAVGP